MGIACVWNSMKRLIADEGVWNSKRCPTALILLLGTMLLPNLSHGHGHEELLHRYKDPIQNYIMTGNEKGWKQCDILSDRSSLEGTPYIAMELGNIEKVDAKLTFASSHCVLINYCVDSEANLLSLLDFGRVAFQHLRLALVIRLTSGLTLDMVANYTRLPFLVAAEMDNGKSQFLCPVVGETDPRLESHMCEPYYASYKNRQLLIGMMGMKPYYVDTKMGKDGVDFRMLEMLAERLKFHTKIIVPPSFLASINMVST